MGFKFKPMELVRHTSYGEGMVVSANTNPKGQRYYAVCFPQLGKCVDVFNEDAMTIQLGPISAAWKTKKGDYDGPKLFEGVDKGPQPEKTGEKSVEAVNHPSHYNVGKIEVIDFIEDKKLNYNLGNAVKYISRCEVKQGGKKRIEDLQKAIFYLNRQIATWEKEKASHA